MPKYRAIEKRLDARSQSRSRKKTTDFTKVTSYENRREEITELRKILVSSWSYSNDVPQRKSKNPISSAKKKHKGAINEPNLNPTRMGTIRQERNGHDEA